MAKMWEEIFEQPEILKRCGATNKNVISQIVKVLRTRNIDFVVVAARGSSDHAGVYGKYIIEYQLGIPTVLAAPSIFTVYGKGLKLKNSLVIGLSQSGMASDVLEVIRHGNREGAVTLSITNNSASPLAREAGFHIDCDAGIEKSVAATKSFTAQMYLIAQLVAEWSDSESMRNELLKVPQGVDQVLRTAGHIKETAVKYRGIEKCFVLARGINYPIALETALKIQETSYTGAKAYASSDFYHGPFAMIEEDIPVIVFAPEGPMLNNAVEMINRLRDNRAELIVVSNNKGVLDKGAVGLIIPDTADDMISPFYNITAAQIFACGLALAKGLDPDAPRGLKKVTVTH